MKHVRTLGFAAAAAALTAMLGAGTASATELCSTPTTPCSGTKYSTGTMLDGFLSSVSAELNSSLDNVVCSSRFEVFVLSAGGSGTTAVSGSNEELVFEACADSFGNSCIVTEEFGPAPVTITGGGASEFATFGFKVGKVGENVRCGALINCIFILENQTFEGHSLGCAPEIDVNKATLKHLPGQGFLCPSTATLTAQYTISSPHPLYVV